MPGLTPPVADEREGLIGYLRQQRYFIRLAAYGLTEEQARATPTISSLSIGGLIKHVAGVETNWMDLVMQRQPTMSPEEGYDDYAASFRLGPDEHLASVLEHYDQVSALTERDVAAIPDLVRPVPVPKDVPWFPQDVEAWSVRWVLLHVIEETARHAGHADIIREAIDGATAIRLMAAAEGWPETPWVKPWRAPRDTTLASD